MYTIQSVHVWDQLVDDGFYIPNRKIILEESFRKSYDWMLEQAKNRIPRWNTDWMIWVWKDKPDLRKERIFKDPDGPQRKDEVLIELEIPDELILFSGFEEWHFVLNNIYLPDSYESDYDTEDEEEIKKSWVRCFNSGLSKYQGVIDSINLSQVVKRKKFTMINTYKPGRHHDLQ